MPGFNKKGPQNKGPMTGGRCGLCMAENTTSMKTEMQPESLFCIKGQRRGTGCINRKNNGMGQSFGRGRQVRKSLITK